MSSPEGGPPEGVSPRVFLNLRRTHEYRNLHTHKQLSFCGNVGTHKNRRISPWHNALGFFSWGRSLKVHTEIKRQSLIYNLDLHHSGPYHWFQLDVRSQKENRTQVSKTNLQSRFSGSWPHKNRLRKSQKWPIIDPQSLLAPLHPLTISQSTTHHRFWPWNRRWTDYKGLLLIALKMEI